MKALFNTFIILISPIFVYAEINCGYTIEWLSHESCLIAKATPLEMENTKGPEQVNFIKTRFKLNEVLKGPLSNDDIVTIYDYFYNDSDVLNLTEASKSKKQLIIFVKIAENMFEQIDGKFVFTENHIFDSAYYIDKEISNLFNLDFKRVKTIDELLKRIQKQVKDETDFKRIYRAGTVEKKWLDIPSGTEAYTKLYAGSSCFLWLPNYIKEEIRTTPVKDINLDKSIIESWGNQKDFFIENDFEIISWEQAKNIMLTGSLRGGKQYHTGWLTIYTMMNEKKYLVKTPQIDSIWEFAKEEGIELRGFATE